MNLLLALVIAQDDWKAVGEALGKAGDLNKDGSYKVTVLRTDVEEKNGAGMPVPAALGLNSYAAFVGTPKDATVVGDTCMLAHEVNPVIDDLRRGGIEVVAIHNHMLGGGPQIIFLHFQGKGDAVALAKSIRGSWDELGKPAPAVAPIPKDAKAQEPDWKEVSKILGREGPPAKDGCYKVTLPRAALEVKLDGRKLAPGVGLACWVAFYACPCGKTMAMGDTCVTREELQGAIDSLRKGGVKITALHNHALGENTQVMFMHFEVEGDALETARTVRSAWDGLRQ